MREFNLSSFAKFLEEIGIEEAEKRALELGCEIIEAEAKRVIGTYDYGWQQLAEATRADRARQGYPENEPLLRTGEMRDSIGHTILIPGKLGEVGSNNPIAVYQELGTATIPARSFLAGAAAAKGQECADVMGAVVADAIASHTLFGKLFEIVKDLPRSSGTRRESP